MRTYELMAVFDPELEDSSAKAILDGFLEVITKGGGSLGTVDIWGRRRLAYEIDKKSEGIYAVAGYTASPAVSQELDRQLGLDERVMRVKIIRVEEQMVSGK